MRVSEAADIWVAAERQWLALKAQHETAAKVLKKHFAKSGKSEYRGEIRYGRSTVQQLDGARVREYLGKRLAEFQTSATRETLSLIE